MATVSAIIYVQSLSNSQAVLLMTNVEALADVEGGVSGCTVSVACSTSSNDYVACTGRYCERNDAERWVQCDGIRTYC